MSAANKKIIEGMDHWECGTTTLIGGLLLPMLPSSHAPPLGSLPRSNSWSSSNSLSPLTLSTEQPGRMRAGSESCAEGQSNPDAAPSHRSVFVCVSLGDCKAFHYSCRSRRFTDITEGNRQNLTDARDPGGRLGPYIESQPDLRNLHLYFHLADPGDLIILMSDGIHDNLDPQQLGVAPPATSSKVQADTWEEAEKIDSAQIEAFKNNYRKNWLEDTFSKQLLIREKESTRSSSTTTTTTTTTTITPTTTEKTTTTGEEKLRLDVTTVVDVLLQHCVTTTKASREFMERNPKLKLPPDFKLYPGKLDHATCVCLKVGGDKRAPP